MSEMVLLHCGLNDFTSGPMPLREAVAYIAEAVEDGMDCVGTHEVREPQPSEMGSDLYARWIAGVHESISVMFGGECDCPEESAIDWLRSQLK